MTIFNDGADDFRDAARGLAVASAAAVPVARKVLGAAGVAMAEDWSRNARARLSGGRGESHAWAYPDSITSDMALTFGSIAVDVGPDMSRKHGFLGRVLESGGERGMPTWDGLNALQRAAFRTEPLLRAAIDGAVEAAVTAPTSRSAYTIVPRARA